MPAPARLLDRKDIATLNTIKIIGRKKYKKLLKAGIIAKGYDTDMHYRKRRTQRDTDLRTTIRVLSNMINLSELPPVDSLS